MYCKTCGCENENGSTHCAVCGSLLKSEEEAEKLNVKNDSVEKIEVPKKDLDKNKIIILSLIAAIVLVVIISVAVVAGLNSSNNSTNNTETNIDNTYVSNTSTTESTTAETTTETTTQKVNLSESCDKILASGSYNGDYYELVATQEETYSEVIIKIGVIKNNEWLIPLTADSPFINDDGSITYKKYNDGAYKYYLTKNLDDLESDTGITSYYFVGNGCFFGYSSDLSRTIFGEYPPYEIIYNAELDKECKVPVGGLAVTGAFVIETKGKECINSNKIVFNYYSEDYVHNDFDIKILNTDSMTTETIIDRITTLKWNGDCVIGPLSDGLFAVGKNYKITAFYNEDGNKVIDMSEYDIYVRNCVSSGKYLYFENGEFQFVTTNDAGTEYNVIIDKSGNVLSSVKSSD